jgi:thymidine kinase
MTAKNDPTNEYLLSSNVIIIDEAQFFPDIVEFVLWLVEDLQKDVIVVGLDGDANRKPFGRLLELVPIADRITKLKSFCSVCLDGTEALFTFCKSQKNEQILVGGSELYMPLCRKHYIELSK